MSPGKLQTVRTNTKITMMTLCPCICTSSYILCGPFRVYFHKDALLQAVCLAPVAQRLVKQGLFPLEVTVRLHKIPNNSL